MAGIKVPGVQSRGVEFLLPLVVMVLIGVMIIPLPPILLDLFLSLNVGVVVLLMLVTLNVRQPLELSVFPSALLLLTLTRLALNVATTRSILLDAHAGKLVDAFGRFVVGGNLVVGLVVFLILIIIQFVVITKGASRISEVSARFTLDAMPGKQMAIDADLNAGIINEDEARRRRKMLMQEAEFYGSMDGASKFVRGDAIAGLIITVINIVGGVIIGMMNGMSIGNALQTYSVLTVGDGLVSQIPALIIATAAGLLTTKSNTDSSIGPEISLQFLGKRTPLVAGAVMMTAMALVPGLPKIPFLALAGGLFWLYRKLPEFTQQELDEQAAMAAATTAPTEPTKTPMEQAVDDFLQTDRACVEIGARLIPLVDPKRGLSLLQRIGTLRRDLARRTGIWVPLIRVRDNARLEPEAYTFMINGQEVARGRLRYDSLLAIHPQGEEIPVEGEDTVDPAFGLPARWIPEVDRAQAEIYGCTVVDAPSVLITHLREVLRRYSGELLSREDFGKLVEKVKESSPQVVDELVPGQLSMGTVHRIMTLLLEEHVPITNLTRIFESLSANVSSTKDPNELVERIRLNLNRAICEQFTDEQGRIHGMVFEPRLELELRRALQNGRIILPPEAFEGLILKLATELRDASARKQEVALLVDSSLRRPIRVMLQRGLPDLAVISYSEVPIDTLLEPEVIVRYDEVFRAMQQS